MILKVLTTAAVLLVAAMLTITPGSATTVGLALALGVDTSNSIDAAEYTLQRQGYVNAFRSANVQNAITNAAGGNGILVMLYVWSSNGQQAVEVPWTHITNATQANAFADSLDAALATRNFSGVTGLGQAITFGATQLANLPAGFTATRFVLDISGDGEENQSGNPASARNAALAGGVNTINGIAIGNASLFTYFQNNVQGGTGSFTISASDFAAFQTGLENKIVAEVRGSEIPEPSTYLMLSSALLLAGLLRRKK
jgi:hypothetical protein